jgi:hypothetical protein
VASGRNLDRSGPSGGVSVSDRRSLFVSRGSNVRPTHLERINSKIAFAYRKSLVSGLSILGMIFWTNSPQYVKGVAANKLMAEQKAQAAALRNPLDPENASPAASSTPVKGASNDPGEPSTVAVTSKSIEPVPPSPSTSASDHPGILRYQVESKDAILAKLCDPDSAQFENVYFHTTEHDGKKLYAYCGTVNAKNGFGGYAGKEEFIAAPTIAATRSQLADFAGAWKLVCSGTGEKVFYF